MAVALSDTVVMEGEGYVPSLLEQLTRKEGTLQRVRVVSELPADLHIEPTDVEISEQEAADTYCSNHP